MNLQLERNDLYNNKRQNITKNGIAAVAATATISKFERNRAITKYGTATATIKKNKVAQKNGNSNCNDPYTNKRQNTTKKGAAAATATIFCYVMFC